MFLSTGPAISGIVNFLNTLTVASTLILLAVHGIRWAAPDLLSAWFEDSSGDCPVLDYMSGQQQEGRREFEVKDVSFLLHKNNRSAEGTSGRLQQETRLVEVGTVNTCESPRFEEVELDDKKLKMDAHILSPTEQGQEMSAPTSSNEK